MTAESTEQAKKTMPWTESVHLYIAAALVAAVVLFLVGGALFADTDATMRSKILGKWQMCPKNQNCVETSFKADGTFGMKQPYLDIVIDLRGTWSIHNGEITLHVSGGGDWFSSWAVSFGKLLGTSLAEVMHLHIRFEGDSAMYIGREKLVRLGRGSG